MMTKKTYITMLIAALSIYSVSAQTTEVETYSSLEIGYDVSEELPKNVVLGVNGQVYIKDNSDMTERIIKDDLINDFLLWVEKGVVSENLAIGSRDLWLADYVFEPDYKLLSLKETQDYVKQHRHLPGVIGQNQLDEQGYYRVNEMLIGQLKNLEELVLHTIAQEKKIDEQAKENDVLKTLISTLENRLTKLENR